jgi:hypothetical protein
LIKKCINRSLNYFGYEIVKVTRGIEMTYSQVVHLLYFKEVYNLIADVKGDVVECGIGYGNSFFELCCLAYLENKGRKIYGFDSFEGFPEPSEEDKSPRNPRKGEWNVSTVETIEMLLTEKGKIEPSFIKSNVRLIKGFFEDSLQKYDGKSIAFLHLDVDLYNSYKVTLEYFWPKVVRGGVVLFDEYKNEIDRFPGGCKAIDEFFGDLITQIEYNELANRYFIVKR